MELIRRTQNPWMDPFDVLSDLQEDFNRIFTGSLRRIKNSDSVAGFFQPDLDLSEDANSYTVKADVPGVSKEDVKINFTGNTLEIKGERKEEKEKKEKGYYHCERRYGSFSRVIEFPTEVESDKAKAAYKDGVLEITVPKSEKAKPKQIQVEVK